MRQGAKDAVRKAWEKAAIDVRPRIEDVLLRLLAGTDAVSASFDRTAIAAVEASARADVFPDGKPGLRLKAVLQGSNEGERPVQVTLLKATLVTAKGDFAMLVKGSKGEPFSRTWDPATPKMIEYGALLPPRWGAGTRALVVFELDCAGVKKSLRTPVFGVEQKE